MATATATARRGQQVKEYNYVWEGRDRSGKLVKGDMRAGGTHVVLRAVDAGAMRLVGRIVGLDGSSGPFRGTWTPLADGRVRQFFEQSTDGVEWTPWFDGYYSPRARVGD